MEETARDFDEADGEKSNERRRLNKDENEENGEKPGWPSM